MAYLTPRCFSIARLLMERGEPVTIEKLARALHVSARTIRYDLDTLEDWLGERSVRMVRKSRVGIALDAESPGYAGLGEVFSSGGDLQRVYSGEERQRLTVRRLLTGETYTLAELAALTGVSKSTVFRDLEELEPWLQSRRATLVKGRGVAVEGAELDLRKILAALAYEEHGFPQLLRLMQSGVRAGERLDFVPTGGRPLPAQLLARGVSQLQWELGISFTDEAATELFVHLGIELIRTGEGRFLTLPEQNLAHLRSTEEFAAARRVLEGLGAELGILFPDDELGIFTMHVLGAGVNHLYRTGGDDRKGEAYFRTAVADFISEVSRNLDRDFTRDEGLRRDLMLELKPWVSRARFQVGLQRQGELGVRAAYPEIFREVWAAMPLLETQFNEQFDETLAEGLSAHVAAAEERLSQRQGGDQYVTAIVVCGAGLGAAKLLSSRISSEFSQIKVLQELSLAEFREFDASSVDVVFSAVPMGESAPANVIQVAPLLDLESKTKIYEFLGSNFSRGENRDRYLQKIMMIVENSCVIEDREKLHRELEEFLYVRKVHSLMDSARSASLAALVPKRHIAAEAEAADFKEAITIGGELLLKTGAIDEEYIGAMIEHTINFRSDVVVAPHVALAHASSKGHVREVCMSVVQLKRPVRFGLDRNDPVKLVFCLGTVDNHSHEKAIYDILKILENKYLLDSIMNAKSAKEIQLTINGIR